MEGAYVAIGVLLAIILYLVGRSRPSAEVNQDNELKNKIEKQEEVVDEAVKEFNTKRDKFIADHISSEQGGGSSKQP